MPTTETQSGVIVDPSVLFTEEALEWLHDPEVAPWLVVSASLYGLIRDGELGPVFEAYDVRPDPDLIGQIYQALEPVRKFSYQEPRELPGETGSVLDTILSSDDPLRELTADEWVFLTTQSFAVLAKTRATLGKLIAAGAHVYEATTAEAQRCLKAVRDKLPAPVLNAMKAVGRNKPIKWLVYGGNVLGLVLPHVALPAKVAGHVVAGVVLVAGDP
jgi:hypothetical protein